MYRKYKDKKFNSLLASNNFERTGKSIGEVVFSQNTDSNRFGSQVVERDDVLEALEMNRLEDLIKFSRHFYRTNIMYTRMIDFLADAYFYYWSLFPVGMNASSYKEEDWWTGLEYIETWNPEKFGPELVRKVLVNGSMYIYIKDSIEGDVEVGLQELDANYCAVRNTMNGIPVVTFNLEFFEQFRGVEQLAMLDSYPKEISDAFQKYNAKSSKVQGEEWIDLDHTKAFMFSLRDDEVPYLVGTLLDMIDHDSIKTLNMIKLEQELSKMLIQSFKVSNDGIPSVDLDEMAVLHKNLIDVARNVPGLDAVSTFGEIKGVDIQKDTGVAANHPVTKSAESIYDTASMPQQIFNTNSVGGMKFSLAREMGAVAKLVEQLEEVINVRLKDLFEKDKSRLRINFLKVNRYNQADMIGQYKEQTTIGFSKFLPAIALGQRQSSIMGSLEFENAIGLRDLMVPPASSNTMSSKDSQSSDDKKKVGAQELDDGERSEKTEQNRESIVE